MQMHVMHLYGQSENRDMFLFRIDTCYWYTFFTQTFFKVYKYCAGEGTYQSVAGCPFFPARQTAL